MLVDYPVHQLEADEGDGKYNSRVLVNITGRDAEHLVNILGSHHGLGYQSRGGGWGRGAWRVIVEPLLGATPGWPVRVVGDGVLATAALAVPRRIVHLKVDSLEILEELCGHYSDKRAVTVLMPTSSYNTGSYQCVTFHRTITNLNQQCFAESGKTCSVSSFYFIYT